MQSAAHFMFPTESSKCVYWTKADSMFDVTCYNNRISRCRRCSKCICVPSVRRFCAKRPCEYHVPVSQRKPSSWNQKFENTSLDTYLNFFQTFTWHYVHLVIGGGGTAIPKRWECAITAPWSTWGEREKSRNLGSPRENY